MIKLRPLSHALLSLLHDALADPTPGAWVNIPGFRNVIPVTLSEEYIRQALDTLLNGGYAEYDKENDIIKINEKGIRYYENQLEKEGSFISSFSEIKDEFFHQQGGGYQNGDALKSVPASDRTVTPTDNQREEAAKALEDFIKEFQKDHHFGNEWAVEKGVLLEALESGKAYLENKVINVRIGTMMTIDVLKEVVAKYDQAAVSGTVSAMAQKVIDFLVDFFKDGLG